MHDLDRTQAFINALDENELEFEFDDDMEFDLGDSPFDESQEMELASELLQASDDEELEQFLGAIAKKAAKAAGKFLSSPAGKALGKTLKGVAKKALPVAGAALGNLVVPGVGGAIGGKLGSLAGGLLEMEGMDDLEFETARRVVRTAAAAGTNAAKAPSSAHPVKVAKAAVSKAVRDHLAPALQQQAQGGRSGRWVRRGRKVILYGV